MTDLKQHESDHVEGPESAAAKVVEGPVGSASIVDPAKIDAGLTEIPVMTVKDITPGRLESKVRPDGA